MTDEELKVKLGALGEGMARLEKMLETVNENQWNIMKKLESLESRFNSMSEIDEYPDCFEDDEFDEDL